jgi:hypothetical protein
MQRLLLMEQAVERHWGRPSIGAFAERPDALLTAEEVGDWLKIARCQVQRLGIPRIDLGRKTPRYQVKDVLEWLETRRREGRP